MNPVLFDSLIVGTIAILLHILGILSAISALLRKQSSQSAIAWAISCVTFPYLAVPAYWILGKDRFHGYVNELRISNREMTDFVAELKKHIPRHAGLPDDFQQSCRVFEHLAEMPFTSDNRIDLIIDGEDFFEEVFRRIGVAKDYILLQFFIVRADPLGERLRDALLAKVKEGVRVYFLYDQIGSHRLSKDFIASMRRAGVDMRAFKTSRNWTTRFQINFRNHRKVVVVDGRWAASGGANLGEEYCGKSERFGYWRDTMVAVEGPAVQEIQLSFAKDWFFVADSVPEMLWTTASVDDGDHSVLAIPTGPADRLENCNMMITEAINTAEERLWISSPYFVPDDSVLRALQLAALRGVDVRILLPMKPDHKMVYWASFTFLDELESAGVKFFRYGKGMLHQKVLLIDDYLSMIGSCNMDNRSLYLNFEIMVLTVNRGFAADVYAMLREDFGHSQTSGSDDYRQRGLAFRLIARLSRLFSPVL